MCIPQSGQSVQTLNSAAVTWSLAKELYGPGGPYFIIPMALLIGIAPTLLQWLIAKVSVPDHNLLMLYLMVITLDKRWQKIGPIKVHDIMLPIIYSVRETSCLPFYH